MNGFGVMASQFQLESLVKELDAEYDQAVDEGRMEDVTNFLNDALERMEGEEEQHPVEEGVAELIRSAYAIYLLSSMGNPNVIAIMARDLVPVAMEFNNNVHPLLLKLNKKIFGKGYE